MRFTAKILGIIAIAAILITLTAPIVAAETTAAALNEKWRCKRLVCRAYASNGRKNGQWLPYGSVIRVVWRNKTWLKANSLNAETYGNYFRLRDFSYQKP